MVKLVCKKDVIDSKGNIYYKVGDIYDYNELPVFIMFTITKSEKICQICQLWMTRDTLYEHFWTKGQFREKRIDEILND